MAVNLSPVGGVAAQFFDNNGVILSGGKIYTYAAGTTTNQATYTNAAGTTAHSNPIILDSAGRVPGGEIWLTDGLSYKFVLKNANDVTIGTYDNIIGINSNFVNFTNQQEFQTATAGQTVFNLATMQYQVGTNSLSVFVDGVNQYGPGASFAYVETDSDTVTFTTGLHVGAEVKFTTSQLNSAGGTNASAVIYDPPFVGGVSTTVENKLSQFPTPKDFGAIGDGVADDTAAFTALEGEFTGQIIDLNGLTYLVSAYPAANTYVNGNFIVSATTYNSAQNDVSISSATDTGGIDPAYTGGVIPLPTISGRTTADTLLVQACENSRSEFVRAVNIGSIYSWAKGNVSGNYSARQSLAWVPQSANIASEECWVWGGFRGANLASIYSGCENESNANIAVRSSYASGRNSANFASTGSYAGRGGGARFTVTVTTGAVTAIAIDSAGANYLVGDAFVFYDRSGSGAGAAATVAAINGTGGITGITLSSGGSGYSSRVDATVDNGTGDFSANVATSASVTSGQTSGNFATFTQTTSGLRSASVASSNGTTSGENAGQLASDVGIASGAQSAVIASNGSTASGVGSAVLAGNNSQSTADGSLVFGRRTINNQTRSFAFGDNATGSASTANRKFHMFATGNMSIAGTLTQSAIFTDYAEYFENATNGKIDLGVLVSLDGRKVKPTQEGDDILGVVSATASIAAGDSPFQWSKRHMTGEFGQLLYHDILDPDWQPMVADPNWKRPAGAESTGQDAPLIPNPIAQPTISVPIENPDYQPDVANVPRSERPDEWTCVGLLGQVHVRIASNVQVGDYIAAGDGGIGIKSATATNMRCMEIRKSFDAAKGYAVGFCLLK